MSKNTYLNQTEQSIKKSGFTGGFSDGVASVGYGKSKSSIQQESRSTSLTQSAIGSLKGNSTVIAGGDLTATAVIFSAGKDINLEGENGKCQGSCHPLLILSRQFFLLRIEHNSIFSLPVSGLF